MAARRMLLLACLVAALAGCDEAAPEAQPARVWPAEEAVATLRARLSSRGYGRDVTGGPMVARWDAAAPPPRLATESTVPAVVRCAAAAGTWRVLTEAGSWWVWDATDQGPIDGAAEPFD